MSAESHINKDGNSEKDEITLSAAILAPLNAIFEAQVHAARAFLSFVFQMGFRHKYTEEELLNIKDEGLKAKIVEKIETEKTMKNKIEELESTKYNRSLTAKENETLWNLKVKYDDLYYQKFNLLSSNGETSTVFIPNLALLPIKPLSVNDANFKFELNVTSSSEKFDQMGAVEGADEDRPWFLIKPKRVKGTFSKGNSEEQSIKVEVNISTTDMPYGLDKLLTTLTNNISVTSKIDIK